LDDKKILNFKKQEIQKKKFGILDFYKKKICRNRFGLKISILSHRKKIESSRSSKMGVVALIKNLGLLTIISVRIFGWLAKGGKIPLYPLGTTQDTEGRYRQDGA